MMAAAGGSRPDVVAADVDRIADAIEQAREAGLPLAVPEDLARACRRITALLDAVIDGSAAGQAATADRRAASEASPRHDRTTGNPRTGTAMAPTGEAGRLAQNVPLRRMIWIVIEPGEEVTVGTVVDRLHRQGLDWPANKVSNALGYWVERGRLRRSRKGVYQAPDTLPDLDLEDRASTRRDQRAEVSSRDASAPRGMEPHRDPVPDLPERHAM